MTNKTSPFQRTNNTISSFLPSFLYQYLILNKNKSDVRSEAT